MDQTFTIWKQIIYKLFTISFNGARTAIRAPRENMGRLKVSAPLYYISASVLFSCVP